MTKVFTIAHMPQGLSQMWLQHLRDFDTAHPGCHFEVALEAPDVSFAEAVRLLKINPALTFTTIFEREVQANAATYDQGYEDGKAGRPHASES